MKNFKIIYPRIFALNSCVYFVIDGNILTYKIDGYNYLGNFFLRNVIGPNDRIFEILDIDPSVFMKKCFNMKRYGSWPVVPSLDMLKEQLKYLEYYYEI